MFLVRQAGPSRLPLMGAIRSANAARALPIASIRSHSSRTGLRPSDAYLPPQPASPRPGPPGPGSTAKQEFQSLAGDPAATRETPADLTPEQRDLLARIIRVDQAGELGANWIYRGQKLGSALRGDRRTTQEVEEMWENERLHLKVMRRMQVQHGVRPTLLWPVWQGMALGLGLGTSLLGREAAMACTEAVETVIGEHYDDQLKAIKPMIEKTNAHPSLPLMASVLEEFRDDELEHLDAAVEGGAQKAPGHSLLSAVIGLGCKAAIKVCERV